MPLFIFQLTKTLFTILSGCFQFDHSLMEGGPRPLNVVSKETDNKAQQRLLPESKSTLQNIP